MPARSRTLVKELFTGYASKAPYARVEREYREVKPARMVLDTPDKENAMIRARLDFPLRDDDPDAPALTLANDIFGGGAGLSNRLIERLRQKDGLSYGAGTGLSIGSRNRVASWTMAAIVAPQNAARAEQAMREELERARRDGFTAKEVDDAKKGILQERLVNRSQDGVVAGAWVNNLDLGRTFEFSKQFEDRLRALTPEQVNAAFRKYIDPEQHDLRDRRRREEGHQVMSLRRLPPPDAAARPLGRSRPAGRRVQCATTCCTRMSASPSTGVRSACAIRRTSSRSARISTCARRPSTIRAAARYDDELEVCGRIARIGTTSLQFSVAMFRRGRTEAPLVAVDLVYVYVDAVDRTTPRRVDEVAARPDPRLRNHQRPRSRARAAH